jgi:ERCC4-type nuclease
MIITIDEREINLYDKCVIFKNENQELFKNIQICKKVLLLGDIVLETDDGKVISIIERKSLNDLVSSVRDGRYEEQSHRLINCSGITTHNILYILEGMFSQLRDNKDKKLIYSAITSLNLYKGFSVLRTCSIQETVETIMYFANKIEKNMLKGISINTTEDASENLEPKSYSNFVKKVKRENITPENIGEIFLCQIPGISSQTASSVMKEHKTIINLICKLQESPDCLNNIMCGKRKIGKNCIENIKIYLLT